MNLDYFVRVCNVAEQSACDTGLMWLEEVGAVSAFWGRKPEILLISLKNLEVGT